MSDKVPSNSLTSLISDKDPPPFQVINRNGTTDLLLVCDHAGQKIPQALLGLGLKKETFNLHVAYDVGASQVACNLSDFLDAPLVLANYSRLLIDPNRSPEDPESILPTSDGIPVPGNKNLDKNSRNKRVRDIFNPYHDAIHQLLEKITNPGKKPAFLSIHSFSPEYGEKPRPWDIGVLWNSDQRIAIPLMKLLKAKGLNVGDNLPYSGHDLAYTIDRHGGARKLPNCAVEINQNQLQDETGIMRWSNILGETLIKVVKGLD